MPIPGRWKERFMPDEKAADLSSVECIPGMGPIRTRALRKAGWETMERLRKATLADLMAVPGITEIKARQILDYLAGTGAANGPAARKPSGRAAAPVLQRQGGGKSATQTTQRQTGGRPLTAEVQEQSRSKLPASTTRRQSGGKPPRSKVEAVPEPIPDVMPSAPEADGPLSQAA